MSRGVLDLFLDCLESAFLRDLVAKLDAELCDLYMQLIQPLQVSFSPPRGAELQCPFSAAAVVGVGEEVSFWALQLPSAEYIFVGSTG